MATIRSKKENKESGGMLPYFLKLFVIQRRKNEFTVGGGG